VENGKTSKAEKTAELVVRRFFTHYLIEIFPKQLAEVIAAHNCDINAHSEQISAQVKIAVGQLKLWVIGLVFAGGIGGGVGLAKFLLFNH